MSLWRVLSFEARLGHGGTTGAAVPSFLLSHVELLSGLSRTQSSQGAPGERGGAQGVQVCQELWGPGSWKAMTQEVLVLLSSFL